MSTHADPSPPTPIQLQYTLSERTVSLHVDEELFARDAIYGAAYLFVDRCWLFMEGLAGEFANELLNQAIRIQITESTATLREYTMARAFFTTPVQSSIDALLAELDAEELEEDELEISVPWEDSSV